MDTLPIEMLWDIFKYLDFHDRCAARLTCKQLYKASLSPDLIKNETFVISKTTIDTTSSSALSTLKNSEREFLNLEFQDVDFTSDCCIWDKHGLHIKSLSFHLCDINSKQFLNILEHCRNLESLRISYCRNLFMAGTVLADADKLKIRFDIKDLEINRCNYLCDAIFARFMDMCPNLRSLSLNSSQISFHGALFRRFYPQYFIDYTINEPSKNVLTFVYIIYSIMRHVKTVKCLNFGFTYIDKISVENLLNLIGLKLDVLILNDCVQLNDKGFDAVVEASGCRTLTHLNVSRCSGLNDQHLEIICKNMKNLKILDISHCDTITNEGVVHLKELYNLIELNISCCRIDGEALIAGILLHKNTTLKKLFAKNISVTENTLINIANRIPELTHLNLSNVNGVNDRTAQEIFKNVLKLISLKLSACENMTDYGLTGVPVPTVEVSAASPRPPEDNHYLYNISLKTKAELEIINDSKRKKTLMTKLANEEIYNSAALMSIKRLSRLQQLELSDCIKLSDVSLQYAVNFVDLKVLKMTNCSQITNEGLKHLVHNAPGIIDLDLSHCHNLTDLGVDVISRGLKCLNILSLRCIKRLTSNSIYCIISNCKYLHSLDVRDCEDITDASLQQVWSMEHIKCVNGSYVKNEHFIADLLISPPPAPRLPESSNCR